MKEISAYSTRLEPRQDTCVVNKQTSKDGADHIASISAV